MKHNTQKNFILQFGALIALYISVTSLMVLIFSVTNLHFPDEAANYWESESARGAVRNSIAMLIVFFPAFLTFTRLSNQDRRAYSQGEYSTFAKWLVYLTILGGVLILLADLVTLIMFFLNGEITSRFIVKVGALLLVVGGALGYYILDVKGYFKKNISKAVYFGIGASVIVVSSVITGYTYIETPTEVREIRLDAQQTTDLQDMYWRIEDHYRLNSELPQTLKDAYMEIPVPTAPEGREQYEYSVLDVTSFELCATFVSPSGNNEQYGNRPSFVDIDGSDYYKNNNWEHVEGRSCFKRTVQEKVAQ